MARLHDGVPSGNQTFSHAPSARRKHGSSSTYEIGRPCHVSRRPLASLRVGPAAEGVVEERDEAAAGWKAEGAGWLKGEGAFVGVGPKEVGWEGGAGRPKRLVGAGVGELLNPPLPPPPPPSPPPKAGTGWLAKPVDGVGWPNAGA